MALFYSKKGVIRRLVRSKCIFLLFLTVCCSPPEDPIKCSSNSTGCTITNSYGAFPDRSVCRAHSVVWPRTEQELVSAVASATMKGSKIKVATRFSHSIPKLVCPSGEDGLLISTKYLNRVLNIDIEAMTITAEAGVTLKELINEAANVGLALPYAPYWWGLTIGGLLGTGAHGSTLWGKGSSVHDYVTALKIVSPGGREDGYVKVRVLNDGDEELNAARVSLGVLGVISQVTLRLQPLFKRSITYSTKNDSDLGDEAASFGKKHEFADIIWYPSQHKAVYRIDDRVPTNTSGDGLYDFRPFRSTPSIILEAIRTLEEFQESWRFETWKCIDAKLVTSALLHTAYGLTNNGVNFKGYPVIGYQHRLQASGSCLEGVEDKLTTACAWDPRVKGEFFHQTTFSIGLSSVKSFIQDVQRLVELHPKALCGLELNNGILMRYVTASSAYLGKEEKAVDFDFTYYRSKDPMTPRLYEDVIEEIEQMAVIKYGALPHWGKNRNIVFDGVINKYKNADKFLAVKKLYDPLGIFSSEWTDQVLGLQSGITIFKEGCALEGLCICREDSHCAPSKGYFCRPGKVFEDARVCARQKSSVDGLYDFTHFRSTPSITLAVFRTTEENQESWSDDDGKCIGEKLDTSALLKTAFGLTSNASGSYLEGVEDKRITACAWDPRVKGKFFHQTTFSIGLSSVKSFIQDVQRLVELQPKALCGLEIYNGIFIRYVTASSAYLGIEEEAVDLDFIYYGSKDPTTPRPCEDVIEEIEQMAVIKYGALPHWGKNQNIVFDRVINKYKNADKFLAVKKLYEPMGLLSSEWTDQVRGLQSGITIFKEGCALEGLCICQQNIHCAPSKGYFCTPGKVFEDARVCSRRRQVSLS